MKFKVSWGHEGQKCKKSIPNVIRFDLWSQIREIEAWNENETLALNVSKPWYPSQYKLLHCDAISVVEQSCQVIYYAEPRSMN